MKPTGGPTRKDCSHGKTPDGGGKDNIGVMGNGAQSVKAAAESAPARTKEVVLGQPVPPSLLKIEGKGSDCYEKRESTALESRSAAHSRPRRSKAGAGDGLRTRYLDLGKVALYQVSYSRAEEKSYPATSGRHLASRGAPAGVNA
jgi:hypothetical protein